MAMVDLFIQMEIFMKEIEKMTKRMGLEHLKIFKVQLIKECGLMINKKEKA